MIFPNSISEIYSQTLPGTKAAFGSPPIPSPTQKRPLGVLPHLPQHKSDLWKSSHALPNTKAAFGSSPTTSLTQKRPLGVLPRPPQRKNSFWEMPEHAFLFRRAERSCVGLLCCAKKTAGEAGRFVLLPRRECGRGRMHCVCGREGATASRIRVSGSSFLHLKCRLQL